MVLLEVWKRLVRQFGEDAPHLLVIGSPAWRGREILDMLRRSVVTNGRIHCISGLSSPALKRLIAGSRGVLLPSFAEGFGLPVIEAEQLGIPVVASDIDAHREVIGSGGVLVDPLDGPGWLEAISALMTSDLALRVHDAPSRLTTRRAYAEAIHEFIGTCADGERRRPQPSIR